MHGWGSFGFRKRARGSQMSSNIAIKIENLSKCYQIYDKPHDRLKQSLYPRAQRLLGMQAQQYFHEFWSLRDVSFEIKKGETVGIIGRNGSGKSTLLQIICGTLNQTSGSVMTNGRIAALLELGSGFNPEFTGRENVYMNAAVIGLSREETDLRFDDIAAFSGIGQFIDQPVKSYSSGMMVRLAFSVAINVDPEILIIDEALAVGDELFQRKCFARLEEIRETGATVLFVSHSGSQIIELCDRAVLLDAGELLAVGAPKQIVGRYQKLLFAPEDRQKAIRDQIKTSSLIADLSTEGGAQERPQVHVADFDQSYEVKESFDPALKPTSTIFYESRGALIEDVAILDLAGNQVNNLVCGKTYIYSYLVRFQCNANNVRFGMLIKTIAGVELGGATSAVNIKDSLARVSEGFSCRVEFRFNCALNSGVYFMNAGVMGGVNGSDGYMNRIIDAAMFKVMPSENGFATGVIDFSCVPDIQEVSAREWV